MPYITVPVGALQTNCYLITDDEGTGVAVDPGAEPERILEAVRSKGLKIEHILLTHTHFDHILAVDAVQKATGADLLVPRHDEPALRDSVRNLTRMAGEGVPALRADRLLDEGDEIKAGRLTFSVLHTPGHTPGGCCYLCGDLLISGDTLFEGDVGRTDLPGGDEGALRRSLRRLRELDGDYTLLPGHGPASRLSAERTGNPYLREA